jgi:hypothetical protein
MAFTNPHLSHHSPNLTKSRIWRWKIDAIHGGKLKLGYSLLLFAESFTHTPSQ